MEEHIPVPNSDPEYRSALTPTSSIALRTCAHATLGTSTEWTNEKHILYIDSLETSFVNKLYHSMRLRDCHPQMNVQGTHSSQELPFKTYNSSDQFMVVRDRRFQKNFPRNGTLLESTADSHVTLESPWICHFTAAGKSCNVAYPNLREHIVSSNTGTCVRRKPTLKEMRATARSSEHNPACHQGSVGNTTVSGQNFVDEDHRGKLSCEFIPKRFKRASADASSNGQLVPLRNFDTNKVSMAHNALPEGDEQGHHQLLSEHPESFICAKTIFTVS